MGQHLVAFGASVNAPVAPGLSIAAVADQTVNTNGANLYVPATYNQAVWAMALSTAHALTKAQLQSPTLREMFFPDIEPTVLGAFPSSYPEIDWFGDSPLQLTTNEGLNMYAFGAAGGATPTYGLVQLADGPIVPTKGKIFSIHGTGAATLADYTWVNTAMTFDSVLPVGNYDVVGMRVNGAHLVGARLVFIGSSAITRPGVPGTKDDQAVGSHRFRKGNCGVLGTFNSTTPPSLDCLGNTDTAQTFTLDLIQR